ncbi:hypothetical protein SEPCBS119000_004655 [Sporothrix epigloea]|uniref:DUF8032 domain-containing protein n=1 Tax=Sporothrix epigloea TaxID=1892477 RepID=A0ABP0DT93_9PEZI
MSRSQYPPITYHTPQSHSPASVASTGGHDQQRSVYGQPPQLAQQHIYYSQHQQYQPLPSSAPSPYGQHPHAPHQSMGSQPGMIMTHGAPSPVPHQVSQHPTQHSSSTITSSPRHAKLELQSLPSQLPRQAPPNAPSPLSMGHVQAAQNIQAQSLHAPSLQQHPAHQPLPSHQTHQSHPPHQTQQAQQTHQAHQPQTIHAQQGVQQHSQHPHHLSYQPQTHQPQHTLHQPHATHQHHPQQLPVHHSVHNGQNAPNALTSAQTGNIGPSAINPNAAPGPIPATTPLVVRQDQNGVQWIAFEYSRDRVKMEYTIRCDVESVSADDLSEEFKQDNCVYPRACCPREQYRGNRLQYESECNTVGWSLAQLNPALRGKRGLIQRAVDSWRNSNQDSRLRSRRVRRMAKLGSRKAAASTPGSLPSGAGQQSPAHLAGAAPISNAGTPMGKSMHGIPQQPHQHTDAIAQTGSSDAGMYHQL